MSFCLKDVVCEGDRNRDGDRDETGYGNRDDMVQTKHYIFIL